MNFLDNIRRKEAARRAFNAWSLYSLLVLVARWARR